MIKYKRIVCVSIPGCEDIDRGTQLSSNASKATLIAVGKTTKGNTVQAQPYQLKTLINMMRTGILISLLLSLISCKKSRESEIRHFLTNDSNKYWIKVYENPIKWYSGINFDKSGNYTEFTVENNGFRNKINLAWEQKWKLANDSTISFTGQGINLRIVYINNDILVLNNLYVKQLLVYSKCPDQKTLPIADTTNYQNRF